MTRRFFNVIKTKKIKNKKRAFARFLFSDQHKTLGLYATAVFHVKQIFYFPMQKLENISPSRSSEVNTPVISQSSTWAKRNSSANKSNI